VRFYDAFHGVGGFRYGLEQAGMTCVGGCEIDKYACQAYGVINYEDCRPTDIRTVDPIRLPDFDIFVGGFPCQDLSVAGKRKGFDGSRSVLFFEILRICAVKRPTYLLLENVTGLFSHNNGETFRIVLQSLDELGYDAEWQVHNSAAYVPQNRERVFIIGHLRGTRRPEVFPFGCENENAIEVIGKLEGNHDQNSRIYGISGISPTLSTMQGGGQEPKVLVNINQGKLQTREDFTCLDANYAKGLDNHGARTGLMVKEITCINPRKEDGTQTYQQDRVYDTDGVMTTLSAELAGRFNILEPIAVLTPDREEKRQNGRRFKEPGEPMFTLTAQDKHGVAILRQKRSEYGKQVRKEYEAGELDEGRQSMVELEPRTDGIANTLTTVQKDNLLYTGYRIRKLTPLECMRLQSFPDWWYYKLKEHGISDSQLYKMAGNAVTSEVARQIGIRLMAGG
jgi:DNA (cytosine-5)-methyltransferase 1